MSSQTNSFQNLIYHSERPVLVDFWAEWCGPCRMVSPVVQKIAQEYSGQMTTIKINVDKKPQIAAQYNIRSIPTIMMFWNGQPIMQAVGAQSYDQIKHQIDTHWPVKN